MFSAGIPVRLDSFCKSLAVIFTLPLDTESKWLWSIPASFANSAIDMSSIAANALTFSSISSFFFFSLIYSPFSVTVPVTCPIVVTILVTVNIKNVVFFI